MRASSGAPPLTVLSFTPCQSTRRRSKRSKIGACPWWSSTNSWSAFIGIEERAAARVCAEHVRSLGHRRLGIVTFPLHADGYSGPIDKKRLEKACFEVARRRMQGYLRVIEASGSKTSTDIWECLRRSEEDGRPRPNTSLRRGRVRPRSLPRATGWLLGCLLY